MDAELLLRERYQLSETSFAELVVWRVPAPVSGSAHSFKYRLAYVVRGRCMIRYDNEAGKGDHKHHGARQTPYWFTDPAVLLEDFWKDVDEWQD